MSSRSRAGGLPSGPGGLPRGPGSRARSVTRTRDAERTDRYDSDGDRPSRPSRQIRPQKSTTSMNHTRSRSQAPLMPSSRSSYDRSDSRAGTNRSSDSTAASGSSFFERMKQTAGYASTRTSLEEDDEPEKPPPRSMRNLPSRRESSPPPDSGEGYTLWSKVASAASTLTVNVGKAWATNITTFAGEDTPVGQESRLTRAMKAYHLEKARDPSDLPAWLFDEKERRRPAPEPTRPRTRARKDDYDDGDEYEAVEKTRAEPPPSRGLRDIYDAAASKQSASARSARNYADDSPQPSKATDRLKALRDAKRMGISRDEERTPPPVRAAEPAAAPRRVGLPSGPSRRG